MLTLFLVLIITKGALTLYEGNTIGRGAISGGDTAHIIAFHLLSYTLLVSRYTNIKPPRREKPPPNTHHHSVHVYIYYLNPKTTKQPMFLDMLMFV